MKFWTALQYPLCQAALVSDGKIVRTIPANPPKTPARRVGLVAEFDDSLIIGRRNSIELWNCEGTELRHSVYHPWIYSLHDCVQVGRELLFACATLDVVFRMDLEGQVSWEWWAYRDNLAEEPRFVHSEEWRTLQLTQNVEHDTAHLNSVNVIDGQTVLATLLRRREVVEVNLNDQAPKSRKVTRLVEEAPHDFQVHSGQPLYGTRDSIILNGRRFSGYSYVKRVEPLSEDRYIFTHEQGVTEIDHDGNRINDWRLPRPFGVACLERK